MGSVTRDSILRWTVPASAALHGLLFVLLLVRFSHSMNVIPIGVEVSYSDGTIGTKITKQYKPRAVEQTHEKTEIATKRAEATAQDQAAQNPGGTMGVQDGAIVSALERYKYELRLFLDSRKTYPETARRLSQTGTVVVQFKILSNGEIGEVVLEKPAASEVLNKAAVDLVKRAEKFKPLPSEAKLSELKLSFPIEYIL